ncbi:MAG: F0F1 ATP synthase subunit epsilon [Vicinamibacterales bacterium]
MALPSVLALELVTPDRAIVHEDVEEIELPGSEGYFGVLPGHTPLLATLGVGEMWYRRGNEKFYLSLSGGFAEVLPDRVIVLAQIAERAEDIDLARAEQARARAEERLTRTTPDLDVERARLALLKQLTRIRVAQRARSRG